MEDLWALFVTKNNLSCQPDSEHHFFFILITIEIRDKKVFFISVYPYSTFAVYLIRSLSTLLL